jgi:hypothetical protein
VVVVGTWFPKRKTARAKGDEVKRSGTCVEMYFRVVFWRVSFLADAMILDLDVFFFPGCRSTRSDVEGGEGRARGGPVALYVRSRCLC